MRLLSSASKLIEVFGSTEQFRNWGAEIDYFEADLAWRTEFADVIDSGGDEEEDEW